MTPPLIIPRSAIDFSDRGRTVYNGIESLAESIEQNGLVQPIVLEYYAPLDDDPNATQQQKDSCGWVDGPRFKLSAGGRRLTALDSLNVTELHHGVTSEPGRYGYVLKGQDESTQLQSLLTEIAENLDRHNLDWRDETRLIVRAFKLARAEASTRGEELIMRDFGATLGCGYMDLKAAVKVVKDLDENPQRYATCTNVRGALAVLLGIEADRLNAVLASRMQKPRPVREQSDLSNSETGDIIWVNEPMTPIEVVNLSDAFRHTNGVNWLLTSPEQYDHIITDPDYGISIERLSASVGQADVGVAQASVEQTLNEMKLFFQGSFRALRDYGFLIFFYDLDHHEKLQELAARAGFIVRQRPLIWHKTDYRSNAAPSTNFCGNYETAMVCRKPGAVLQKIQMSSIFPCASEGIQKELNHPFAKPRALWKWLFEAVTVPGQTVFDPFFGSGSMPIAAIEHGLTPMGCEIQEKHFHQGLENIKRAYQKKFENVRFE